VTAPIAYLRLHGRNYKNWFRSKNRDERYDYLYKPEELEPIAKSMKAMVKKVEKEPSRRQAKKMIAATNNHYKGQAAVNAIDLKKLLGIKDPAVPGTLAEAYGVRRTLGKRTAQPGSSRPSDADISAQPLHCSGLKFLDSSIKVYTALRLFTKCEPEPTECEKLQMGRSETNVSTPTGSLI
jgi:hypothetical protein